MIEMRQVHISMYLVRIVSKLIPKRMNSQHAVHHQSTHSQFCASRINKKKFHSLFENWLQLQSILFITGHRVRSRGNYIRSSASHEMGM